MEVHEDEVVLVSLSKEGKSWWEGGGGKKGGRGREVSWVCGVVVVFWFNLCVIVLIIFNQNIECFALLLLLSFVLFCFVLFCFVLF